MPRHQRHRRGGRNKAEGWWGAISLGIFKFKLWLCDPFVDCRKAGGARRAEYEEECGMTYVEYMFRAKNRETMWTPRMDLPPPRLNEDFLCSSKSSPTPATTPGSTSAPTSYYSDDTDRDSNDTDSDEKEEEVSLEPVVVAVEAVVAVVGCVVFLMRTTTLRRRLSSSDRGISAALASASAAAAIIAEAEATAVATRGEGESSVSKEVQDRSKKRWRRQHEVTLAGRSFLRGLCPSLDLKKSRGRRCLAENIRETIIYRVDIDWHEWCLFS
eukprot:jgi/Undpi1/8607/HiC_scaffold_25.g11072.m1